MPEGAGGLSCSRARAEQRGRGGHGDNSEGTPHLLQADFLACSTISILPSIRGLQPCAAIPASRRAAGVQAEWAPSPGTGCTQRRQRGGSWAEGAPKRAGGGALSVISSKVERAEHASLLSGDALRRSRRPGAALLGGSSTCRRRPIQAEPEVLGPCRTVPRFEAWRRRRRLGGFRPNVARGHENGPAGAWHCIGSGNGSRASPRPSPNDRRPFGADAGRTGASLP